MMKEINDEWIWIKGSKYVRIEGQEDKTLRMQGWMEGRRIEGGEEVWDGWKKGRKEKWINDKKTNREKKLYITVHIKIVC